MQTNKQTNKKQHKTNKQTNKTNTQNNNNNNNNNNTKTGNLADVGLVLPEEGAHGKDVNVTLVHTCV